MLKHTLKRLQKQKADRKRKGLRGFTLVEILVVLVILAILASALIVSLTGYIDKTKERLAVMEARRWFIAAQASVTEVYASHKPDTAGGSSGETLNTGGITINVNLGGTGVVTSETFRRVQELALSNAGLPINATDAEKIAYTTLQYVDSLSNSRGSNDYNFKSKNTVLGDTAQTPDEFFSAPGNNDDVAVNIYYSETGHITYIEFAKKGVSKVIRSTKTDNELVKEARRPNVKQTSNTGE